MNNNHTASDAGVNKTLHNHYQYWQNVNDLNRIYKQNPANGSMQSPCALSCQNIFIFLHEALENSLAMFFLLNQYLIYMKFFIDGYVCSMLDNSFGNSTVSCTSFMSVFFPVLFVECLWGVVGDLFTGWMSPKA